MLIMLTNDCNSMPKHLMSLNERIDHPLAEIVRGAF